MSSTVATHPVTVLTAFKNILTSSKSFLIYLHLQTQQITNYSTTFDLFFCTVIKTSFIKSLWILQVTADNLFFHIVSIKSRLSWRTNVCVLDTRSNEEMFFSSPFSTNQHELGHEHFSGISEWSKTFIIFKNIVITS